MQFILRLRTAYKGLFTKLWSCLGSTTLGIFCLHSVYGAIVWILDDAELDFNSAATMWTLMCEVHTFLDTECFLLH